MKDRSFALIEYKKHIKQAGFTLIEIMVVVVILAILAAIVVPKIMSRPEQARLTKAKNDVSLIEQAMDMYKLDNGFYPSQDQGIQALVTKPASDPIPTNYADGGYIKQLPMDPWGKQYQYKNPGTHSDIDIYTVDPNQKNMLIANWDTTKDNAENSTNSTSATN
jgi:general secretion pathway protein G